MWKSGWINERGGYLHIYSIRVSDIEKWVVAVSDWKIMGCMTEVKIRTWDDMKVQVWFL